MIFFFKIVIVVGMEDHGKILHYLSSEFVDKHQVPPGTGTYQKGLKRICFDKLLNRDAPYLCSCWQTHSEIFPVLHQLFLAH